MAKAKAVGKNRTCNAKCLQARPLLRPKRRPWSSFPMTKVLKNTILFAFSVIHPIVIGSIKFAKANVLTPTRLRDLSHSYFLPYFGRISVSFSSKFLVFLCILCVLSPFGTVLVSNFGINFLKNRRRKNSLFFFSK